MSDVHPGKQAAAERAAAEIADGSRVGLGTGSTAALFVKALGRRVRAGLRVVGVPTSEATAALARAEGITVVTLEDHPALDVAVDGADAVTDRLDLVKGLGGALLREKIVALAARRFVVIADASKRVASLAAAPPVPVEVVVFGWSRTCVALEALGAEALRRPRRDAADQAFVTDGGNYILDCRFGDLSDPDALAARIKAVTGVVDHGFFLGMAAEGLIGADDGSVLTLSRPM